MQGFKTHTTAGGFYRSHALIRNLSRGFSDLAPDAAARGRLASAWATLAATL